MYECAACGFTFDLADAESVGPVAGGTRAGCCFGAAVDAGGTGAGSARRHDLVAARVRLPSARRAARAARHACCWFAVRIARRPEPMGRDERVEHDGYAAQDPEDVARQLEDAAALFANVLARLEPDGLGASCSSTPIPSVDGAHPAVGRRSTPCTSSCTTAPTSTHSCCAEYADPPSVR